MGEGVTAIVLAGGRATRLSGVNKAKLEVGGVPIIERVVSALRLVADQIVLVGHLAEGLQLQGVEILPDPYLGAGTLAALRTGMLDSRNQLCIAVGCDMPFLSPTLLQRIANLSKGFDVTVPRIGPHLEALHAAYRVTCLPVIENALDRRRYKIIDFYGQLNTREVPETELRRIDPDLRSFMNVNTAEDLEKARAIVEGRASAT